MLTAKMSDRTEETYQGIDPPHSVAVDSGRRDEPATERGARRRRGERVRPSRRPLGDAPEDAVETERVFAAGYGAVSATQSSLRYRRQVQCATRAMDEAATTDCYAPTSH